MNTDSFKLERVTKDIVIVLSPTKEKLAELMVRFQEHYESSIPEIKGHIFSLGALKMAYAQEVKGAYTYVGNSLIDGDWSGFNFPNYVLEPFIRGLFDPLTQGEHDLVEMLKYRTDKFYVIGAVNCTESAIDHEINHALYYLSPIYKARVDEVLQSWDQVPALRDMLASWGYCEDVLTDEVQAYIGADFDWLKEEQADDLLKFKITLSETVRDQLVSIKKELFSPLDQKYIQK